MTASPILRISETYDAPTLVDGLPQDWTPTSTIVEEWGTFRIELGAVWSMDYGTHEATRDAPGDDITEYRGSRTRITTMTFTEPHGEGVASLTFPSVTPFDDLGGLPWTTKGVFADIWHVLPIADLDSTIEYPYWHGRVFSREEATDLGLTLHLAGALTGEAAARGHQPIFLDAERDIGTLLAQALDPTAYTRPIAPFPGFVYETTTTDITTRQRGSRAQSVLAFADEQLAMAQDATGQWTISRAYGVGALDPTDRPQARKFYLRRKGSFASPIQENTVSVGARGVTFQFGDDVMDAPNAIHGEGVDPSDGSRWRNAKFPNLNPRTPPTYPGDLTYTDTDPIYGADWIGRCQAQMRADGRPDVQITGVYDDDTATAVLDVQSDAGLPADGFTIDEDTFDAIYAVEGTVTSWSSGYFRPLAWDQATEPYLYYADGSYRGANPLFDPSVLRVEQVISYGESCRKGRAQANAGRLVARETATPDGWAGTVTLEGVSPEERCAMDIREGGILTLRHFHGADHDFYIAGVTVRPEDRTVILAVDKRPYDLMALQAKIARNTEARHDPARSLFNLRTRTSKPFADAVGWDKEAGGGQVAPVVITGGTFPRWEVFKLVGAQYGTLAAVKAITTSPASRFAMALFGREVTSGDLDGWVPDPLAENTTHGGLSWWSEAAIQDDLAAAGFLEAWGEFGSACGYWPADESNDPTPTETGKMLDSSSLSIASGEPPFLWLPVWFTEATTFRLDARITIAEA